MGGEGEAQWSWASLPFCTHQLQAWQAGGAHVPGILSYTLYPQGSFKFIWGTILGLSVCC